VVLGIEWAYYLNEERKNERAFFAALQGVKLQTGNSEAAAPANDDDSESLVDRMVRMFPDGALRKSKMDVGYIKVSPEELERRRKALENE